MAIKIKHLDTKLSYFLNDLFIKEGIKIGKHAGYNPVFHNEYIDIVERLERHIEAIQTFVD